MKFQTLLQVQHKKQQTKQAKENGIRKKTATTDKEEVHESVITVNYLIIFGTTEMSEIKQEINYHVNSIKTTFFAMRNINTYRKQKIITKKKN